jgi:hypothetical protein
MQKLIVAVVALVSATRPAAADEPRVSITVSPLHLIMPFGEVTAELRAADKVGIAVIAGAGSVREDGIDSRITLLEAGANARYYVWGSFRSGIELGAEAVYVHASADDSVSVSAEGLGLSPFAGYKWTHRSGFTLDGQLGATFIVLRGKADTGAMAERKSVGPMLNLQVGYSF